MAGRHAVNDGSYRRSVFLAAGRAAALVAAAVILGVFILQATDNGTKKPKVAATATTTSTTRKGFVVGVSSTTSTTRSSTSSTTSGAIKKPSDLNVIVLNATGRNGAAGTFSATVGAKGYKMLPAGTAIKVQKPTVVYFKPGLNREGAALAAAIDNAATAAPLPSPPPGPAPANADLVIVLGSDAK
jgi:hypothetical protein